MRTASTSTFRFDAQHHEYLDLDTGTVLPHITGMLQLTGWIDDTWFTEESSERGTAVHRLTADYDLGALDVESCVSKYRGYLLGHSKAMAILRPEILAIEEPIVHPTEKWGGRPDRVIKLRGLHGVLEIKTTAAPARSHQVQTALQAMLASLECGIPADGLQRQALYLKDRGKFTLVEHTDKRDFIEAQRVIARCCR